MKQCSNVTPKSPPKFLRNLGGLTGRATNRGFTIIELLVVISIIVILTGIVLVSYKTGEQQLALQRAANKLAQDIRKAQGMAILTEACISPPESCCPPPGPPCVDGSIGVPLGGYGFYINKNQDDRYFIYADSGSPPGIQRYSGGEKIETIYLEEGVYIDDFIPSSSAFSINFKPPDPEVTIKNNAGDDSFNVTIIIALRADPSKTKTILVNKTGRIDID